MPPCATAQPARPVAPKGSGRFLRAPERRLRSPPQTPSKIRTPFPIEQGADGLKDFKATAWQSTFPRYAQLHCEWWRAHGGGGGGGPDLDYLEVLRVWQVVHPPTTAAAEEESGPAGEEGGEEGWWRRQLRGPGVRHGPVHWELRVKHVCTGGDVKASPELPLLAGG